jgi:hypothetical protein
VIGCLHVTPFVVCISCMHIWLLVAVALVVDVGIGNNWADAH